MAGPAEEARQGQDGFACELGLFQWKRMPFGLCNATATFQRLMAHALIGVTKKYGNLIMCYVDDKVNSDVHTRRSHRATGRGVCMYEEVGAKV